MSRFSFTSSVSRCGASVGRELAGAAYHIPTVHLSPDLFADLRNRHHYRRGTKCSRNRRASVNGRRGGSKPGKALSASVLSENEPELRRKPPSKPPRPQNKVSVTPASVGKRDAHASGCSAGPGSPLPSPEANRDDLTIDAPATAASPRAGADSGDSF